MARIGINGFGRIGRVFLRTCLESDVEVVAINEPFGSPKYLAYMFKHDTTHGRFYGNVCSDEKHIIVNKQKIVVFKEKDGKKIPWKQACADYILDSSGLYKTIAKGKDLMKGGGKKVLISAPSKDAPMYVVGVNLCSYDPKDPVVSMASCTTTCLAPLVKVVNDAFGIEEGLMTTIHSVTPSQKLIDGAGEKKPRSARSGMANIIPATTGAAKAVAKVIPEMKGKLTGMAFRVPTTNVSVVDLTVRLCKGADYEEIKCRIRQASEGDMNGILGYTEDDVVSQDMLGSNCSAIFDANAGMALNDNFVKLICWYDNEWGYCKRLVDTLRHMHKVDNEAGKCGKKSDKKPDKKKKKK